MYVQGVSTRKVSKIVEELCGHKISSSTVSRLATQLDEELERWRQRPLDDVPYLVLDARYEHVRRAGTVVDSALLIAIGITADGHRTVLGVSVSDSEAEVGTAAKRWSARVFQKPGGPRPAWNPLPRQRRA